MVLGISGMGEFSGGIFPMLKLFQAGGARNVAFGILVGGGARDGAGRGGA
jgi:hypothetical protein